MKNSSSSHSKSKSFGNSDELDINRKLSIIKYRKKQAANDAQLLMNRIALLQKEEERARKKIDQTKDRASGIILLLLLIIIMFFFINITIIIKRNIINER